VGGAALSLQPLHPGCYNATSEFSAADESRRAELALHLSCRADPTRSPV